LDTPFFFKLVLSFFVGGLWTVGATVVADRSGPKMGGLISGLPSTVVLGLFFIAWTQGPPAAVEATTVIPLMGGINSLFVVSYACFVKKNVWLAVVSGLITWSILSFVVVKSHFHNYAVSIFGYVLLLLLSFYLLDSVIGIASVKGKKVRFTSRQILARGLLGGLVVSLAVSLGKIGGPLWGGMFSMFPAMFLSTMLVTFFAQGALFSAGTMKSAMLSAISVVVYTVIARLTFIPCGMWLGTLLTMLVSYGSGWAVYRFIIMKLR